MLLAEDNADARDLWATLLTSAGAAVALAASGPDGSSNSGPASSGSPRAAPPRRAPAPPSP